MLQAWRPLLFSDEDLEAKEKRDPIAPSKRSEGAFEKIHAKKLPNGDRVHSFRTLLKDLNTMVRNKCRRKEAGDKEGSFTIDTTPSASQQRALDLIKRRQLYEQKTVSSIC